MSKGTWGGAGRGGGRKSKAEELGLRKTLDAVFTEKDKQDVFLALLKEAKKGSTPHAQLLLAYYYGKPTETVNNNISGDQIIRLVDDTE